MVDVQSHNGMVSLNFYVVGPRSRSNFGSIASALQAATRPALTNGYGVRVSFVFITRP